MSTVYGLILVVESVNQLISLEILHFQVNLKVTMDQLHEKVPDLLLPQGDKNIHSQTVVILASNRLGLKASFTPLRHRTF